MRVIWLRPDDFHNTLLSSCLMHFRGNNSMNHIIVNKVIKYIKAYMIDRSYYMLMLLIFLQVNMRSVLMSLFLKQFILIVVINNLSDIFLWDSLCPPPTSIKNTDVFVICEICGGKKVTSLKNVWNILAKCLHQHANIVTMRLLMFCMFNVCIVYQP